MVTTIRDLDLLHALDALPWEESVTAAARRALLTTPAMSRALGRIRHTLADPLLVRAGRHTDGCASASWSSGRHWARPHVVAPAPRRDDAERCL
jgi:hypothetical protein